MKVDDFAMPTNLANAPELPGNFARDVIVKARAVQRRRQIGSRMAAGVAVILLAAVIPWANHMAQRPSSVNGTVAADWQTTDQTDALRLAEAASPDAVSDYLLPNTTALRQFASGYSDASWNYDSDWTEDAETSTGG